MNLTSASEIKALLRRHGFHFSKSMGQNFLTEESIPEKIAAMSGIDKSWGVLEIGPGIGALTVKLCGTANKVAAIELDRKLMPILTETLKGLENVKIIEGDALKLNLRDIVKTELDGLNAAACANLPYYITTPVISALIEAKIFKKITVMVQKEVALRVCAEPGTSEYGAFSVFVNYYTKPEILFDVPAECFMPVPKVNSCVLMLEPYETPPVYIKDEKLFFKIVRAAFSQRRKTFVNSLASVFGNEFKKAQIINILSDMGIPENIRGEKFSVGEFAGISNRLSHELELK